MKNLLACLALTGLCAVGRADIVQTRDGHYVHGDILYQDADSLTIQVRGTDSVRVLRAAEVERVVIIPRRPGAPAAADEPPVTAPGIPVPAAPADTPRINPAARVSDARQERLLQRSLCMGGCLLEYASLSILGLMYLVAWYNALGMNPDINYSSYTRPALVLAAGGLILHGVALYRFIRARHQPGPAPPDTTKSKPVK